MILPVPTAGSESGPQYALDINACMSIIDQHSHAPGYGVQITPSGLNINSDLLFNGNNATLVRSIRFQPQSSALVGASDLGAIYRNGVDLYYIDGVGNNIQITQSGGVAGTPGSISNLVSPASAAYVSINKTFVFQSDVNTPANLDAASVILRNLTANSFALTLSPPNAMAANYSLVLPSIPAAPSFLGIDVSGNISAGQPLTNANFAGKSTQVAGNNIVVSNTNATNGLSVIRAFVDGSSASIISGEGLTVSRLSPGVYTVFFTSPFGDLPAVTVTPNIGAAAFASITTIVGSSVVVTMRDSSLVPTDINFTIIAVGQRA